MDPGLIEEARKLSYRNFGKKINFYYTGDRFPAVSLTGGSCALNCKHCGRVLIERLAPAKDPDRLLCLCRKFHEKGANGVLLTGGCTPEGRVPLAPFLEAMRKIKDETGMIILAHTGLIGVVEAKALKEAGLDGVCLDVVGSPETTREIYGIEIPPEEYRSTLQALEKAGIENISPHVCVGLHDGMLFHEESALDIISCIKPTNVVVIGLTNIAGTPMEHVRIDAADVMEVLCKARLRFPESFISLGCARGKGEVRSEIDRLAVQAGVNNIAVPTPVALREAEKLGLEINEYGACCAILPERLR